MKAPRFASFDYWGKPVAGFGDARARLLVVGLAPAAHGANRTGRMFTGDRSGEWLYRTLHKFGFCNRETSIDRDDGLLLRDCFITAACRCAPPANKPLPAELSNCRPFLLRELEILLRLRVVIGLGKIAFETASRALSYSGVQTRTARALFSHGAEYDFPSGITLLGSYHPSQQNTFTGRLTRRMFDSVFRRARNILELA